MSYNDFEKFIEENSQYETIYTDSEGRRILVIRVLDAWSLVDKYQKEKNI